MLLIGIDEAGYGPRLGPLCHGYCAIRCPDAGTAPPDLWKLLRPAVRRCPPRANSFVVDDSKKIYSHGQGLELLTHSVGAFMACLPPGDTKALPLYCRLLPESDRVQLAEDCWGGGLEEAPHAAPARAASEPLRTGKNKMLKLPPAEKLQALLAQAGVAVAACGARAMSARYYNRALQTGGNKADVNWSVIAGELQRLLTLARPGEHVHAVIDRQGGRKFYAAKISALFPNSFAWVEQETPHSSVYRVDDGARTIRVSFVVEADGETLAVALGSMAAKLARELCMARLNEYFRAHAPDLKGTAGYYGDASRFLRETRELRQKLGIANEIFVRTK